MRTSGSRRSGRPSPSWPGQRGVGISELAMDGEHPLVRLAGVIQLTDYASVYLAIASGIDPGQTVAIRDLRTRIE